MPPRRVLVFAVGLVVLLACSVSLAGGHRSLPSGRRVRLAGALEPLQQRPTPPSTGSSAAVRPSVPVSPSVPVPAPVSGGAVDKFQTAVRKVIVLNKIARSLKQRTKPVTNEQLTQMIALLPRKQAKPTNGLTPVRSLIQTASASESESESGVETQTGWGAASLPIKNLASTRTVVRGQADTNPLTWPAKFQYYLHPDGTVEWVKGLVVPQSTRSNPDEGAVRVCDAMYEDDFKSPRFRRQWQAGHMIASQMGGSPDALNFFPQHKKSNAGNSVYWRTEMIATSIKLTANNFKIPCRVEVENQFDYAGGNTWVPSSGTYLVDVDETCVDALKKSALTAFVAAFTKNAPFVKDTFGLSGERGYRMTSPWVNDEDYADQVDADWLYV